MLRRTCIALQEKRLIGTKKNAFLGAAFESCPVGMVSFLSVRLQSSASTSQCPFHNTNNTGRVKTEPDVKLVDVPKLPLVGSLIPQYSGTVKIDLSNIYNFWYGNWKNFGDFYNIGMVSQRDERGNAESHVLTDPNEFMKVMRKEGTYPRGALESHWPLANFYDEANVRGASALFKHGEEWQRIRRFLQTDMLHPSAAKGYVPGIIKASQIASEGAPLHSDKMKEYMVFASFDMFSAVSLGEFPGLANGKNQDDGNLLFCNATIDGFHIEFPLILNPLEKLKHSLGIKSFMYKAFEKDFGLARDIAARKVKDFWKRKDNGDLKNDFEKNSYASLAIDRYLSSIGTDDEMDEEDVYEVVMLGLIAALDTTSSVLNWTILHLAMNPNVQEMLHKEVSENVAMAGAGTLTQECFAKSTNTYLDAVLRENHRMTPPFAINLLKSNVTGDVEIHGKTIQKGSIFVLDSYSLGMDPGYVDSPDVFDPSRWLEDKVLERKGTPQEKLDHALYKQPFSAGARKCPGSRIATHESKVFLSQLVLDWKISLDESETERIQSWRDIPYWQGLSIQPESPKLKFEKR